MSTVYETKDYILRLLSNEEKARFEESNYGIVHKKFDTIEAACGSLWAGYALIDELQKKLEEYAPPEPKVSHLSTIQ